MKIDVKIDEEILESLEHQNPYNMSAFKQAMPSVVTILKQVAKSIGHADKVVFVFINDRESRIKYFCDLYLNGIVGFDYVVRELAKFSEHERPLPMAIGVEAGLVVVPYVIDCSKPNQIFGRFMSCALRTMIARTEPEGLS